jgi:hypothetical protein
MVALMGRSGGMSEVSGSRAERVRGSVVMGVYADSAVGR